MKLIIQNYRVVGTATEDYPGPETCIDAPDWFDINRMGEYQVVPTLINPDPPVVEEPVAEEPVVEEPAAETPAEEPAAEEPVAETPAETPTDGAV